MKFIFPQNYNFKNKLFGIIDYNTIFLNLIWDLFIFIFIKFFRNLEIKIILFFIFCFPLWLFSFFGFNGENINYIIKYIFIIINIFNNTIFIDSFEYIFFF